MSKEAIKSRVYTDRPAYADFDSPAKFQAIQSIVAKRLREHPHAICSYSGGGWQRKKRKRLARSLLLIFRKG